MIWTGMLFLAGYACIALEHPLKIDKAATALLLGVSIWLVVAVQAASLEPVLQQLAHHFEEIAEILFFLIGAMTIVELIDVHRGFAFVQRMIHTRHKLTLLWILAICTFLLSAVLDNLTTTIVMLAILKKLMELREDQWFFTGFIIIAANAGGAWSPIGDVTTIMLWNAGNVSAASIIRDTFLPSVACLVVPLLLASRSLKGSLPTLAAPVADAREGVSPKESGIMAVVGIGLLLLVPVFKTLTHLPPYMGMIFSLGIFWLFTELWHRNKPAELKRPLSVAKTLQRIDTSSVLFFLGILLSVAALSTNGTLDAVGQALERTFSHFYLTNALLGLLSSVVDNVPLVAGAMGMYSMELYPMDHAFWSFLAYCAGTGGSVLIIGSAAGVAAMGIMRVEFTWYFKRIAWLALVGYLAGIAMFLLQHGI